MTVAELDALTAAEAGALLQECGGAPRWAKEMLARRPLRSFARARALADEVWATLGPEDWRAAFAHHPRIGEDRAAAQGAQGRAWSDAEQAGVAAGPEADRAALVEVNRAYEARFGHIYIVCAAGKSAAELLRIARQRLTNDPERELAVAGEELRQIMQLRLAKLLDHDAQDGAHA